jgi:hypothetical protein
MKVPPAEIGVPLILVICFGLWLVSLNSLKNDPLYVPGAGYACDQWVPTTMQNYKGIFPGDPVCIRWVSVRNPDY